MNREIYIVQEGDTIDSITKKLEISKSGLIKVNGLENTEKLIVGQLLLILHPTETYIAKEGDTLESIAKSYDTTTMDLLRNNIHLLERDVKTGEEIVILYGEKNKRSIKTNRLVIPTVNIKCLKKTLPYLSYISILCYYILPNGNIENINSIEIINLAKKYRVAPIMSLTSHVREEDLPNTKLLHDLSSSKNYEIYKRFYDELSESVLSEGFEIIMILILIVLSNKIP